MLSRRTMLLSAAASLALPYRGDADLNPGPVARDVEPQDIDLGQVALGTQETVIHGGKPIFVWHRTADDIAEAEAVELPDLLDGLARNANLPEDADASDANRRATEDGEFLVVTGICTHLGCIPVFGAGNFGGWYCPCHGAHFDKSGRIRSGPAPENLAIPAHRVEGETLTLL